MAWRLKRLSLFLRLFHCWLHAPRDTDTGCTVTCAPQEYESCSQHHPLHFFVVSSTWEGQKIFQSVCQHCSQFRNVRPAILANSERRPTSCLSHGPVYLYPHLLRFQRHCISAFGSRTQHSSSLPLYLDVLDPRRFRIFTRERCILLSPPNFTSS